MRSILSIMTAMLAAGCGESGSTPSAYLISTTVIDPSDPFVISLAWEPSAGSVDRYTVEARSSGGDYADVAVLPFRSGAPQGNQIDLKPVAPEGGPLDLRIRADPGRFESNEQRYDPGPSLSTVSVSSRPDPGAHAFLVHFGNRVALQTLLFRRVIDGNGEPGPYAQIAAGHGVDIACSDTDVSAWSDGAQYEYQAVSSVPGALASRSATTDKALLRAPEILSFRPGPSGAAVVMRNNSAYAATLTLGARYPDFSASLGQALVTPGNTVEFPLTASGVFHFQIMAQTGFSRSSLVDAWEALQPASSILQPVERTLQFGSSASRDAAGQFCIVEHLVDEFGQLLASAVFAPGSTAAPLMISITKRVKCRIDFSGRAHVIWFQPGPAGAPGRVMHAWSQGPAWKTEVIASRAAVSDGGEYWGGFSVAFDFGTDGTLFVAWYVDANTIELATWAAGQTWTVQPVPAPPIAGMVVVSGDEAGVPHLLTLSFFANYHLVQGPSGWAAAQLPQFQITGCRLAEMSVVGGVVSFISDEPDNNRRVSYLRGNAAGWSIFDLGLAGLTSLSHSADGRGFIALNDDQVAIVREGGITAASVSRTDLRRQSSAGFSANGKAWVLLWIADQAAPTSTAPSVAVPSFIFEEQ